MKKSALKVVTSSKDSYSKTRHNAVRHGILSNVDILPWEDATELQNLRQGFLDDFSPQGASELYLVEELATIAFRKQRLYKAENALIVSHLREKTSSYNLEYILGKEVTLLSGNNDIKVDDISFKEILYPDEEEDNQSIKDYKNNIKVCEFILEQDQITYENALKKLPQHLQEYWQEALSEKWQNSKKEVFSPTIESLKNYIKENILDYAVEQIDNIQAKSYTRQQAVGMAYSPSKNMESLQRYETTMDRLFERKLSVLLKLQDIRNNKPLVLEA